MVVSVELVDRLRGSGRGNVKEATLAAQLATEAAPSDVGALGTVVVVESVAVLVERLEALNVVAVTSMVMTTVLPTARLPMLQVTVVVPEQEPAVVEYALAIYVTSAGKASVTVKLPLAAAGPPLLTVMV